MRANLIILGILGLLSTSIALAQPPADTNAAANPSAQNIESTVHQYLLKKPEVVVEALQAYQQKQMQQMDKVFKETKKLAPQYANDLFHEANDPVVGNPDGKVTVVEFSDYQCSHCIEVAPIVDTVLKANPNLRLVVKEFPIRGGLSEEAARAALAAKAQGKYWEFRNALFKVSASLTQAKIYETAKALGLNVEQLKKDMDKQALKDAVKTNQTLATNLKLIGTPAFFVAKTSVKNGVPDTDIVYVPGIVSQEQLQNLISKASA